MGCFEGYLNCLTQSNTAGLNRSPKEYNLLPQVGYLNMMQVSEFDTTSTLFVFKNKIAEQYVAVFVCLLVCSFIRGGRTTT